jgi:hypothetical protein
LAQDNLGYHLGRHVPARIGEKAGYQTQPPLLRRVLLMLRSVIERLGERGRKALRGRLLPDRAPRSGRDSPDRPGARVTHGHLQIDVLAVHVFQREGHVGRTETRALGNIGDLWHVHFLEQRDRRV